jgi:hypothetical protein
MITRTDYTIVVDDNSTRIDFLNPIEIEKILKIVNITKQEELYSLHNPVKTRASVSGNSFVFTNTPKLSVGDVLRIEYIENYTITQDFLTKVALGLVEGYSLVLKSGRNNDVDTGSIPEDVWNGGNIYTGFPLTSDLLQIVSSSNSDTGVVTFLYLESETSTSYSQASVTITGTTPVNTNITAYRVHSAWYTPPLASRASGSNAGTITIRHTNTPANVFIAMPIATNQSYMAGYTIPFGSTGLLLKDKWIVSGGASVFADVAFWIRLKNQGFRLRRNNTAVFGAPSTEELSGGLLLPEGTDIIPRVSTASANNIVVVCAYDILLISNSLT